MFTQEKHDERLKKCGTRFMEMGVSKMYYCGLFRECEWCYRKRLEIEWERVFGFFKNEGRLLDPFVSSFDNEHEADNFTVRLRRRKNDYRRYPIMDGQVVILHTEGSLSNRMVTFDELHSLLGQFVLTPADMAMSGKLGKDETIIQSDRPEGVVIFAQAIWTDAPMWIERVCMIEALKETGGPDYDSPQEYQNSWEVINLHFEQRLNRHGYKFTSIVRTKRRIPLTKEMDTAGFLANSQPLIHAPLRRSLTYRE